MIKSKIQEERAKQYELEHQQGMALAGENQQMRDHLTKLQQQLTAERAQREEAEAELLEIEDRFSENAQMLRTTISEKDRLTADRDRLQSTNCQLLMRSSSLVESALQLDSEHYQNEHQERYEESEDSDAFFRDFEVGQQVLQSLQGDLGQLHQTVEAKVQQAAPQELEEDISDETAAESVAEADAEHNQAPKPASLKEDISLVAALTGSATGPTGCLPRTRKRRPSTKIIW